MKPLPSNPAEIARLIPHQGRMCLLDAVLDCSPARIRCRARSHRDPANPLASEGALLSPAAIEYAAQAMALHGALNVRAGVTGRPGYIASARGVTLHVPRLDTVEGELQVEAEHLAGDERQVAYRFTVITEGGQALVDGRVTVVLDTPLRT
ncbi:MAG TPA: hydroxymyristoyl-ACP dehydratase [Rubrivivax sp.]|nr:hydroxymyristoyl-ACP dehydratase [Rubrivivax sp.]